MEEIEKRSMITCIAWVAQGAAQAIPEKVEICAEDIKQNQEEILRKLSKVNINGKSLTEDDEDDDDSDWEDDSQPDEEQHMDAEGETGTTKEEDIETSYDLKSYDKEQEDPMGQLTNLTDLTVFVNNSDDPLLVAADAEDDARAAREEEELSETENEQIRPTDNLLVLGHTETNDEGTVQSTLEIYVYSEDGIYPHHENLLPEMPLCMEWLNFNPEAGPGNLVAIGTILPVIEIWDLDLIDGLEPAYTLGTLSKKSKKTRAKKKKAAATGHTDCVLAFAWNKDHEHVLASGSSDGTVILWDLQSQTVSMQVRLCKTGRVQALAWHPKESTCLLAGTSKGGVHVIDCNDGSNRHYQLEANIEKMLWTPPAGQQKINYILASNSEGTVTCIDQQKKEPVWSFKPHEGSCEGLQLSSSCPGLLLTGGVDGKLQVWDTEGNLATGPPTLVVTLQPNVGRIISLKAAVDQPFVFCIGGDLSKNLFKVWDIRESLKVRKIFCPRMDLPVDENESDSVTLHKEKPEDDEDEDNKADDEDEVTLVMKQAFNDEYGSTKKPTRAPDGRISKPPKKKGNHWKKSK